MKNKERNTCHSESTTLGGVSPPSCAWHSHSPCDGSLWPQSWLYNGLNPCAFSKLKRWTALPAVATSQIIKIMYTALSHGRLYSKILEFENSAKETCQVIGCQIKPLSKHQNLMGIKNGTCRDAWILIWVLKLRGSKAQIRRHSLEVCVALPTRCKLAIAQ